MISSKYFDHTILKAEATETQVAKICDEALANDFASVCVNQYYTRFVAEKLKGSDVKVCTVVGFPLGMSDTGVKAFETKAAIEDGAQEIDMVINVGALKDKKYDYVKNDIHTLKEVCGSDIVLKVIIETCLLTDEEKVKACELAKEAGADEIYKVGGAQAIAALAYGTESIPKVDKIVGPGNIFVALAKRCVFGHVSIDSVAGPSEIMVLADETANARYVAADLLSQAEHDEMASAILVTTSEELAKKVSEEVDGFVKELSRKDIIQKSLDNYGYILVADTMQDAIDTVNEIASEHLEVVTANPFDTMTRIQNAGAIFLGSYSSEPLGDYFAGPNHVLPTNGTAKFFSPLSVDDFIKKSSIIYYSREALEAVHEDIIDFAEAEYLTAHANSIKVRFEK